MRVLVSSGYEHRSRPRELVHLDPEAALRFRHLLLDVGAKLVSSLITNGSFDVDSPSYSNKTTLTKAISVPMLCGSWAYVAYDSVLREYSWFTNPAPGVHIRHSVRCDDPFVYVVEPLI